MIGDPPACPTIKAATPPAAQRPLRVRPSSAITPVRCWRTVRGRRTARRTVRSAAPRCVTSISEPAAVVRFPHPVLGFRRPEARNVHHGARDEHQVGVDGFVQDDFEPADGKIIAASQKAGAVVPPGRGPDGHGGLVWHRRRAGRWPRGASVRRGLGKRNPGSQIPGNSLHRTVSDVPRSNREVVRYEGCAKHGDECTGCAGYGAWAIRATSRRAKSHSPPVKRHEKIPVESVGRRVSRVLSSPSRVKDGHLSSPAVAGGVQRSTRGS